MNSKKSGRQLCRGIIDEPIKLISELNSGLLLLGDVTDSTGVVQALVARRRSRLRQQRKLYNNWQTTKLRFRSLIARSTQPVYRPCRLRWVQLKWDTIVGTT